MVEEMHRDVVRHLGAHDRRTHEARWISEHGAPYEMTITHLADVRFLT